MCGRSACTLAPQDIAAASGVRVDQMRQVNRYTPTYNAGPGSVLPVMYFTATVNNPFKAINKNLQSLAHFSNSEKSASDDKTDIKTEEATITDNDTSKAEMKEEKNRIFTIKREDTEDSTSAESDSANGSIVKSEPNTECDTPQKLSISAPDGTYAVLHAMRWGLLPSFLKRQQQQGHGHTFNASTFNARAETLIQKPTYRNLVNSKRCVVFLDGFYEWHTLAQPKTRTSKLIIDKPTSASNKQPYFVTRRNSDNSDTERESTNSSSLRNKQLLPLAGLYDIWTDNDGNEVATFTIITTEPSDDFRWLHDRMPVVLDTTEKITMWLDVLNYNAEKVMPLLRPVQNALTWYPVSTVVNTMSNNSPECIDPINLESERNKAKQGTLAAFFKKAAEKASKEPIKTGVKRKKEDEDKATTSAGPLPATGSQFKNATLRFSPVKRIKTEPAT